MEPKADFRTVLDVGGLTGIEVEHDHARRLDVAAARHRRVQLQCREVCGPHHRRQIRQPAVVDRTTTIAGAGTHTNPVRSMRGTALPEERFVAHAVRKPPHRDAAVAEMGEQGGRNTRVVVDDLALGEPGLGIQNLLEVRELQLAPVDRDEAVGHALLRFLGVAVFLTADFFAGAAASPSAGFSSAGRPVGWRLRVSFAAATLASRAAMRSTTLSALTGSGAATISVSPAALRSMRSTTRLRYVSSNFDGSKSVDSDAI